MRFDNATVGEIYQWIKDNASIPTPNRKWEIKYIGDDGVGVHHVDDMQKWRAAVPNDANSIHIMLHNVPKTTKIENMPDGVELLMLVDIFSQEMLAYLRTRISSREFLPLAINTFPKIQIHSLDFGWINGHLLKCTQDEDTETYTVYTMHFIYCLNGQYHPVVLDHHYTLGETNEIDWLSYDLDDLDEPLDIVKWMKEKGFDDSFSNRLNFAYVWPTFEIKQVNIVPELIDINQLNIFLGLNFDDEPEGDDDNNSGVPTLIDGFEDYVLPYIPVVLVGCAEEGVEKVALMHIDDVQHKSENKPEIALLTSEKQPLSYEFYDMGAIIQN